VVLGAPAVLVLLRGVGAVVLVHVLLAAGPVHGVTGGRGEWQSSDQ
jgi:hypothetical protein